MLNAAPGPARCPDDDSRRSRRQGLGAGILVRWNPDAPLAPGILARGPPPQSSRSPAAQIAAKQQNSPPPPVERRSAGLQPPPGPREGCEEFHDFDAASSRKPLRSLWPTIAAPWVLLVQLRQVLSSPAGNALPSICVPVSTS